ncbi:MAG: TIGR00730 family Rossman fold protein [Candidatus Saccharibacteria bacterium]|nr:TIGR00730 family Rossman fold protein [Candidatus Saccharibacteria bacterium]
MSKFLRDLLDAEEPIFSLSLRDLEKASGHQAVDVKLIADITRETHAATKELGLDHKNTTGKELYQALLARIAADNERVTKLIGGHDSDDVRHIVPFLVDAANKVKFNRKVFVLKHDKAKDLLRQMPPQKLMERLGYKDIEDLFNGENFSEMYTALRFSEGPDWLNEYDELFKSVTASDYEERDIEIVVMDHDKYVDLAEHFVEKKLHNVTHTKELGVIVVVPMKAERVKGLTLKTLPLLFHYMNEVKLYSTFFKLKSKTSKHFGETVMETLIADPGKAAQMAGQHVHWRVIQRYFGKLKDESHLEAFEPHVQPEDLHWRRAESLLYELDPEMSFWKNRDWVGMDFDGRPVTLNFVDVALSYSNNISYQDRYVYHFRESLWNELFARYMGMPNLEHQILRQLDNDMIVPEKLSVGKKKLAKPMGLKKAPYDAKALIEQNKLKHLLVREKLVDAAAGKLIGVIDEFEKAFEVLGKYPRTVSVFGSARLSQDDPACKAAYELTKKIAQEDYAIVTGGGHGIMEAANHAAYDVGNGSVGLNIELPTEQSLNPYTTDHYTFEHFFSRKVALTFDASGYVFCAGGFGTLDELFEITTLAQTGIIPKAPIILYGSDFWNPLADYIQQTLNKKFKTIGPDDPDLHIITDDPLEIIAYIEAYENGRPTFTNYSSIHPL